METDLLLLLGHLSLLKDITIDSLHGTKTVFKNPFWVVRRSNPTIG